MRPPLVIAAISAYNEESNIMTALKQLEKLHIPIIHIHDGAWAGHGYTSPISTDKTKTIVEEYQKQQLWRTVIYDEARAIFRTESEKRNAQLARIHEIVGDRQPYYIFVMDADEKIRFTSGKQELDMRKEVECRQGLGLVKTFAVGSRKPMVTPRLIEGGRGYHYHSEKSMLVHDADCQEVISYDPDAERIPQPGKVYDYDDIFLVNSWNRRSDERIEEKRQWWASIMPTQYKEGLSCQVSRK